MFVISYLDTDGSRYDAAGFTSRLGAEAQMALMSLNSMLIEEKESLNIKPIDFTAERSAEIARRLARYQKFLTLGDDDLSTIALSDINLPKIDVRIDAISNLAEAKTFLKLAARFIVKKVAQIKSGM